MRNGILPMNLQMFADGQQDDGQPQEGNSSGQQGAAQGQGAFSFDYEKLAEIISGKQSVTERTILKNYFKEQGLSKEEAEEAISAFKQQRKENEPDVEGMQQQLFQAQNMAQNAMIEKEGILLGVEMGLDAKSVPYILKMADKSQAVGKDGKVDLEALKKAMNQVLEDIPALKPDKKEISGIQKIGSDGSGSGQQSDQSGIIAGIFGNSQ